jgi:hypothetical protein
VPRWRALGLPADPPAQLADIAAHLTVVKVQEWLTAGFDLAALQQLNGTDVATAARWCAAGLTVEQTLQVLDADPTLTETELPAFDAAGIDWHDALVWIAHGFDDAAASQWRRLDVTPMLARVWRSVGLTAIDTLSQTHPGDQVGLPPGVQIGWHAPNDDPRQRHYSVIDPPGTRGRIAREHRARDH